MNNDTKLAVSHLIQALNKQQAVIGNLLSAVYSGKLEGSRDSQRATLEEAKQSLDAVRSLIVKPPSQP